MGKGMDDASAMSQNVYVKVAQQGVLGMELTKAQIETLKKDENIQTIEPDSTLYATELLRSRELAEEEPYGIEMVLEDVSWWKSKFESSPPTGSAKVCVVDTGYGNGHEDLPTLDENSDGYNPQSSGEWYIDGHSHGTHCAGSIGAVEVLQVLWQLYKLVLITGQMSLACLLVEEALRIVLINNIMDITKMMMY